MMNESAPKNHYADAPAHARPGRTNGEWLRLNDKIQNGKAKVKSYYAVSIDEALKKARTEIGPEAILLHSRKTPLESRHLGPYEVVFSFSEPGVRAGHAAPTNGAPAVSSAQLASELSEMRQQMRELQRALLVPHAPHAIAKPSASAPDLARNILREMEVDDEIAGEILESVAAELAALPPAGELADTESDAHRSATNAILREALIGRLRFAPPSRERGETASIVALIGPPGAGKTASLMKLALMRGETVTKPIHFISSDVYRVGAVEQLRTFVSILGTGLDLADSPRVLAQTIEANLHREMILIDTPGLSGEDFELTNDLADFLGRRNDIEKHLVLPATMRFRDLQRSIRRYDAFRPDRLLFTHLDETDSFGAMYSAAAWSGRPLSFLSAGQQIPEDLEAVSEEKLVRLLFDRQSEQREDGYGA
jgi:flagellar biosynthesis protein FlhF